MDGSILMATSISLPFSFNVSGAIETNNLPAKQYQDRVLGVIFTAPDSRVMRPTYGTVSAGAVFEPESVVTEYVSKAIGAAFNQYLPELSLTRLSVTKESSSLGVDALNISVEYELPNKQVDSLTVKAGTFTRSGDLIQELA
jgi:phage baseplate assembly protein W